MARKKHAKHSKNTILASSSARHPFSKLSASAATAVVGASLALSVTPALAQENASAKTQESAVVATPNKNEAPKAPVKANKNLENNTQGGGAPGNAGQLNQQSGAPAQANVANTPGPVQGSDRSVPPAAANQPKVQNEINISQDQKDSVPNMYAWGKSDNVYIESGQNQSVTFKFAKPSDGSTITKVAIFPSDGNTLDNDKSKRFLEYYSADANAHKPYSGIYDFNVNTNDGTATLTMSKLYRDGNLHGAQSYAANRCIYVYGTNKDGKEVLLYKTNVVRAATLVPPKTAGSIVLKYNEELTDKKIKEKLKEALDAPTEAKDKKSNPLSIRDQITAASKSFGVGGRTGEGGAFVQTPDDADKKVIINDQQAYDINQVGTINTVTSKSDEPKTYKTGVTNLKTYLISDLGYKSEALALTVARYDTRIDKPIVDDTNSISEDVKKEIAKKLANLNHISQDKVTIGSDGTVTINFDGVDADKMPKIALKDLVVKKLKEDQITVPAKDTATVIYNPLGYSKAELQRIKQSIVDANKDNKELGLTSTDQITLEYITGDTVTTGHGNQGISNGMSENTITVKIKTDKAYAEFTSDVTNGKLTRLVDIRKDYDVSWKSDKTKIDGRDTDEGISWGNDSHTTIIYRYDPTAAKELKTEDIVKLLNATPKDKKAGLRDLTGGETLEREGKDGKPRKSHAHYVLQDDEPTGELSLGNMSGAYWIGNQKVSHSDESLGDEQSSAGSYSWDKEAGSVTVAGKKDKIYKARLFVLPYELTHYKRMYLEQGRNPGNTAKAINVIFVPQTNHKTSDLKKSVEEHKLADDKKTPIESKYYNASKDKKDAYDEALKEANAALEAAGNTEDSKLSEALKARIDNATINLNKARAELDGDATKKDELKKSIDENGKPAEGQQAATGTQATNQFKNVTDPDFKDADGNADTAKNNAAKEAKKAYDKALEDAKKVNDDDNATQKAVDEAKAKLDEARKKLNDFTTNKDELNAAIAADGKVNTGDTTKQGDEKLKTADPTYQNSSKDERKAYDDAVAQADKVSKDPNASQKEVNEAIKKLKDAKAALDANATDKSPLEAAVQKTLDNDSNKHSVFYTNAAAKKDTDTAAKKAVEDYDKALAEAKRVLGDKNATKADVDKAKKELEDAEKALYADTYQTKTTDLAEAIADNFSGYLMPAYFNAFDEAQAKGKDSQAAKDFKAYNDAYHAAKDLLTEIKKPNSTVTQERADAVKNKLIEARKAIDKYATDTSKLSAAAFNDLAIKLSPAYQNMKALAEKQNPSEEEKAEVEAAKKAKDVYDKAADKLHKALTNQLPKDQKDGQDIPDTNIPKKDGDLTDKDYLKNIQAHKNGEPLNRDVTKILQEMNDAAKALDKFATKTDDLIKSINKDSDTHQSPAFKNASVHQYLGNDGTPDVAKNTAARKAATDYGEALAKAKDLLKNPAATQADVDAALKTLNEKRAALATYNTDTTKLKESVGKHGKEKQGETAAVEGTKDSDAYRNASDPHFMKVDPNDATKLVEDTQKNDEAKKAKADYDKALAEAQELLKKADPNNKTPLDAQPTQQDINDALKALDEARTKLDTYKTDTTALNTEAEKSQADTAGASAAGKFEDSPEFKNADADQDEDAKADVKAYKEALKKARELVKAATEQGKKNSERPTQQQINDALDALKAAKKQITDNYKTNLEALTAAKDFAGDGFKKTPEYKNAKALKDDTSATADQDKKSKAKADVDALDENTNDSALKKAKDIIDNPTGKTQKEVDEALEALKKAMDKVTNGYKTNADKLKNEVGDKDEHGKDVTPPFEASLPYKNALYKQNSGDANATIKLNEYAEKVKDAQKLIDQVNNPDQNADPDKKPTQKQVDEALAALKQAKKDIDDNFKTKVDDLQKEVDDKDANDKVKDPTFENTTEFANLKGKTKDGKEPEDLTAYKQALAKAKELIDKNDGKVTNAEGKEVDVPKDQLPTQKEVDEALQNLKDIKEKILANYVTSPKDLYDEVDLSKDDENDKRPDLFEDSGAYQRALNDHDYDKDGKPAKNAKVKRYEDALAKAKEMLAKFDRTTGKPKQGVTDGPAQKELDAALAELKAAKEAINTYYRWMNYYPLEGWSTTNPEPEQKPGESAPAPAPAPTPAAPEPEDSLVAPASESSARVASAHAPKHLAQTSDPTNGFTIATMLGSALGFVVAGLKRKRNRR